jgi:hypothetical protein
MLDDGLTSLRKDVHLHAAIGQAGQELTVSHGPTQDREWGQPGLDGDDSHRESSVR